MKLGTRQRLVQALDRLERRLAKRARILFRQLARAARKSGVLENLLKHGRDHVDRGARIAQARWCGHSTKQGLDALEARLRTRLFRTAAACAKRLYRDRVRSHREPEAEANQVQKPQGVGEPIVIPATAPSEAAGA